MLRSFFMNARLEANERVAIFARRFNPAARFKAGRAADPV